jgi:hypothetical protein
MHTSFRHIPRRHFVWLAFIYAAPVSIAGLGGQPVYAESDDAASPPIGVLTPEQREQVDQGVHRALVYLAKQQRPDGSFPTYPSGQPGVTSLCLLAFLSAGFLPDEGPYGERISSGIDYVLSCQKSDGLLCLRRPGPAFVHREPSHTGSYNHAIAGLLLCEVYGMVKQHRAEQIRPAIEKAIQFSRGLQGASKRYPDDRGAWRYLRQHGFSDSDLSVTAWQLTFYRSARNAGFEVPSQFADEATEYVERCFQGNTGEFLYALHGAERHPTRGMVGAGILTLILGGKPGFAGLSSAGDWILRHPFSQYNVGTREQDRFHYGAFYCSQAMYQLGGLHWKGFYPTLVKTFLENQKPTGSWGPEIADDLFGVPYTTALGILALTAPFQLLPVFQR